SKSRPIGKSGEFARDCVGDVKRVAPTGSPPIWNRQVAALTERFGIGAETSRARQDSLTNVVRRANWNKLIKSGRACAFRQPAMNPLTRRTCPGIAIFVICFHAEEPFHPDYCRPADSLLPVCHRQRNWSIRRSAERKLVLTGWTELATQIIGIAR